MKRILAVLLAVCLGLSMQAVFAEEEAGTEYRDEIRVLTELGVLEGYTPENYRAETPMTRGEFCMIVSGLIGFDAEADLYQTVKLPFTDVPQDYWAAPYLRNLYAGGYIAGDANGAFRPEDQVTGLEALKILLSVMGYEPFAKVNGGFPAGYLKAAKRADVSTAGLSDAGLNKGQAAGLIRTCADADMMILTGLGDETAFEIREGRTLLGQYHDIYRVKGQVTANRKTGINTAAGAGDDTVQIDGSFYAAGETDAGSYLGQWIIGYCRRSGDAPAELLSLRPDSRQYRMRDISAEDILPESNNSVIAYQMEGESRIQRIPVLPAANLIRNGVYAGKKVHAADAAELFPQEGMIRALDSDLDGQYDILLVEDAATYVVTSVDLSLRTIYGRYGAAPLQLGEDETAVRVLKNGAEIALSAIQRGEVLSVLQSDDGRYTDIQVAANNAVSGSITQLTGDGEAVVDGRKLKLSPAYRSAMERGDKDAPRLSAGMSGSFYLDCYGKIAAVSGEPRMTRYGFLAGAAVYGSFGDQMELRIYAADGRRMDLRTAARVTADGKSGMTPKELLRRLCGTAAQPTPQMVRFRTDADGRLCELDTELRGESENDDSIRKEFDFTKQVYSTNVNGFVKTAGAPRFLIDGATAIIGLPGRMENGSLPEFAAVDERYFSRMTPDSFEDNMEFEVSAYNISESGVAKAVLVLGGGDAAVVDDYTTSVGVVQGLENGLDADGNIRKVLSLMIDGGEKRMICADELTVRQVPDFRTDQTQPLTADDLPLGALVQAGIDARGEIRTVNRILPQETKEISKDDVLWSASYGWANDKIFGIVQALDGRNVAIFVGEDQPLCYYYITDTAKIYRYDAQRETCSLSELGEIRAQNDTGEGSRIYMRIRQGNVQEVVIYAFA